MTKPHTPHVHKCKAVIYPRGEGYSMYGWPRRRQCERNANQSGYCSQHQKIYDDSNDRWKEETRT